LLNFRPQTGYFGATEECPTQTKQTKIDQDEQVRVNGKPPPGATAAERQEFVRKNAGIYGIGKSA